MSITLQSYAAFSAQQSALKPAQADANSAPNLGQSERALARVQNVTLKALAQEIPGMDVNTLKKRDQQEYYPGQNRQSDWHLCGAWFRECPGARKIR